MALTRKEIKNRYLQKCKENGLCLVCGKEKDRDGYCCTSCKEKNNKRKQEDRDWRRENRICTTCGKERVFGNEKTCLECRVKSAERRALYTSEQKEKYKKITLKRTNKVYKESLQNGICTGCNKRKAEEGRRKCRLCLNKDAERQRAKRINKQNIREYRKVNHLCYYCGGIIENQSKNVCNACSKKMAEYSARAKKSKYWKQENNLIFRNN